MPLNEYENQFMHQIRAPNPRGIQAVESGRGIDWRQVEKGGNLRVNKLVRNPPVGLQLHCMGPKPGSLPIFREKKGLVRGAISHRTDPRMAKDPVGKIPMEGSPGKSPASGKAKVLSSHRPPKMLDT